MARNGHTRAAALDCFGHEVSPGAWYEATDSFVCQPPDGCEVSSARGQRRRGDDPEVLAAPSKWKRVGDPDPPPAWAVAPDVVWQDPPRQRARLSDQLICTRTTYGAVFGSFVLINPGDRIHKDHEAAHNWPGHFRAPTPVEIAD